MATSSYSDTTSDLFGVVKTAIDRATMTAGRIAIGNNAQLKEQGLSHEVGSISLGAPPKFSDLFTSSDNANALIGQLDGKVDSWLEKYFPSINGGFKNQPEDWVLGVISGVKPFGIDSTIFDLVWQKARDRAYRTAAGERATLGAAFSRRGFSLPPGAMIDAMAQSEQRATDSVLDVNRDQAMKDAEIKNDILKHATSLAAQLKMGILNTSAEFFRTYYSVYNLDNETARVRAQAYNSYYSALSAYYNVEVSWEELRLRSQQAGAEIALGIDRNRVANVTYGNTAAAHAQASRGFASIAQGAVGAAGSLTAQIESI